MDYKKIIKSRKLRLKILEFLCFVPDALMLKIQYRIKMGRKLNLRNPERFTEKIQWYKLNYRNPIMVKCVDKYDVRQYLIEKGFENILIKNFGVFNSFEEIDFNILPEKFVMKDTLGGGGNSVYVCEDKTSIDFNKLKKITNDWLNKKRVKSGGREWPYYSGKNNRIIIEELLECNDEHGLVDYKFVCFDGHVEFLYVLCDRVFGKAVKNGMFDKKLNRMKVHELTENIIDFDFKFPNNINKIIEIAEELSKPFPQVRIDMYSLNDKIYFGEFTFFDESGYMIFEPDEFDYVLGNRFKLPQ